jgi:hypothetical protein
MNMISNAATRHLAIGLLVITCGMCATPTSHAQAAQQTWLQKLRQLIGLSHPISAGGSRGTGDRVCLISPQVVQSPDGKAVAVALSSQPTIIAMGTFNEIRIERGGVLVWRKLATSQAPLVSPLAWPLQPIQPNELVRLQLRPRKASGADFAELLLQGGSKEAMAQFDAISQVLDAAPHRTAATVEALMNNNKVNLALQTAFRSVRTQSDPALGYLMNGHSACKGTLIEPIPTAASRR